MARELFLELFGGAGENRGVYDHNLGTPEILQRLGDCRVVVSAAREVGSWYADEDNIGNAHLFSGTDFFIFIVQIELHFWSALFFEPVFYCSTNITDTDDSNFLWFSFRHD